MSDDLKKNILESLKKIQYPGFNRDIVSFGIIKDVVIENQNIQFILNVNTDNQDHKHILRKDIINLIKDKFDFQKIDVDFLKNDSTEIKQDDLKIDKIIAFASCKGGVGKSTISLNVACQLAKKYKVGFLDLDIYGPSLPTMINQKNQPEMKDGKLIPIEKFGVKFMSFGFINNENSPAIWRGPMVARMTSQFFDNVDWGELDYLILDLPPGTGDIQLTLVQKIALTGAVIITTPQDLSLIDVRKGSDMFKKVNTPLLGVIENMSNYLIKGKIENYNKNSDINITFEDQNNVEIDSDGNFKFLIDIFKGMGGKEESKRLNVPLLGQINMDPLLSSSSDEGTPYVVSEPETDNFLEFINISQKI